MDENVFRRFRWRNPIQLSLKGLFINNFDISHPIFGPFLNGPQSNKPQQSHAMPRLVLNRSVQIQPKSWRDFAKGIDGQALTLSFISLLFP